jgi:metallo-beta-lactamase class B
MTCAQEKRAQMKDGASNPFVKPGEFQTFVAGLAQDFDNQLAKQTDALQRS